ncbi:hypothetical protein GBA52_021123 [Prunus armeniaca]|nr:hypothetical protein GBA52_021123 [Prunus armeniaca]
MALELVLLMILFLLLAIPLLLFPTLTSKIFRTHLHLPPSPLALPIIGHYHLLGPLIHRTLHNLSLRFGPLFSLRLGSLQCVVVSSPDLAKEFLSTHELSFISRAQSLAIESMTYNASLAFAPYGPYWKFIKKLTVNELLGNRSINNLVSIRTQEYLRLLRFLAKKAESGEAVNLTEEFPKLWINVILQMIVGNRGLSAKGRAVLVEEAGLVVRQATRLFGEVSLCDFFWVCKKLDLGGFVKRIEETHRRLDVLVEKVIREREELRKKERMEEEEVKDFLDTLLDMLESGSAEVEFTRPHLKGLITCFDWKVDGSDCKKMNGDDVLEMDERPGLTAPRAHDLVCVPVARFSPLNILDP